MLTLKKILLEDLRQYVEIAYKGDDDLLLHYWGTDLNLQEAVDLTMSLIEQVDKEVPVDYYAVESEEQEIGYIVKFPNNLYSFSININYRAKENLICFWELIKEVMEDGFICMLYPQNSRAIKWLQKCDMKIVEGVKQDLITLIKT